LSKPAADLVAFCEERYPRLVGALALYCGDRDVAEELAQEALARVCRDWKKVKAMGSPEAWAHRVGMNLAHSHFRRRAAEKRATERLGDPRTAQAFTERTDLLDSVGRLPHRQRAAVILRYYLGFTVPEVARALECPDGTAKTLLHRGVKALGRSMELSGEAPDAI
jgi:RNA polymerase sigma-70 factor (ECF subfamily)